MEWHKIPIELKFYSFKDFCMRCEEIYDVFWEYYAPFFDIEEYRDYILFGVHLADRKIKQEQLAGNIWEFLMGDIDTDTLLCLLANSRKKN